MKNILILLAITLSVALASGERQTIEYGQDCKERCFPADIKDPLVCSDAGGSGVHVCACAPGLFRHETLNRCVAPTGGVCTTRSSDGLPIATCTEFAVCWSEVKSDPALLRQNGTCHCEPDAKMDSHTGLCKLKHGSNRCSKIGDCDVAAGLNCHYSSCVCRDQTYQTYNRTAGKCEALEGGKCGVAIPPFPASECHGPHMECVKGKCRCEKGYAKTVERKCIQITDNTYIYNQNSPPPYPGLPGPAGFTAERQVVSDSVMKADKKEGEDDEAD